MGKPLKSEELTTGGKKRGRPRKRPLDELPSDPELGQQPPQERDSDAQIPEQIVKKNPQQAQAEPIEQKPKPTPAAAALAATAPILPRNCRPGGRQGTRAASRAAARGEGEGVGMTAVAKTGGGEVQVVHDDVEVVKKGASRSVGVSVGLSETGMG